MRVLFVVPRMGVGGAERVIFDIASGLLRNGHEVGVASSGGRVAEALGGMGAALFTSPYLLARALGLARAIWWLARLLRRERYDLINSHSYWMAVAVFIALRLSRSRARHAFTLHLVEDLRAYRVMGRTLGRITDGVVTVCQSNRVRLVAAGLWERDVHVIHNGVDVAALPMVARRSTGTLSIGIVARLIPRKGHPDLFHAFAAVAKDRGLTWAKVRVIGTGPEEERLKLLADELGIAARIEFMGDQPDVPALLQTLDIAVLPSTYEGLPISILEAMATGLPVVASDVDGIPEIIEHGRSGLLVKPRDVDGLSVALSTLAGDPELRTALGEAGGAHIRRSFDASVMADETASWFRRLIGEDAGGAARDTV